MPFTEFLQTSKFTSDLIKMIVYKSVGIPKQKAADRHTDAKNRRSGRSSSQCRIDKAPILNILKTVTQAIYVKHDRDHDDKIN